jgi:hypothetical protein
MILSAILQASVLKFKYILVYVTIRILFTLQVCITRIIKGVAFHKTVIFIITIKTVNNTSQSFVKPTDVLQVYKPANVWTTEVQHIETQQNC